MEALVNQGEWMVVWNSVRLSSMRFYNSGELNVAENKDEIMTRVYNTVGLYQGAMGDPLKKSASN